MRYTLKMEVSIPRNHMKRLRETMRARGYPPAGSTLDEMSWSFSFKDSEFAINHARVMINIARNVTKGMKRSGNVTVQDLLSPGQDGNMFQEKI